MRKGGDFRGRSFPQTHGGGAVGDARHEFKRLSAHWGAGHAVLAGERKDLSDSFVITPSTLLHNRDVENKRD
jgi:hypothetical protein